MRIFLALTLLLFLSSCGVLSGAASLLGGGSKGPTVNSNAQIGKENTQQIVANQTSDRSTNNAQGDIVKTDSQENIEAQNVEIFNYQDNWLLWLFALLGWILPSPNEIWRGFLRTITLGRYRG